MKELLSIFISNEDSSIADIIPACIAAIQIEDFSLYPDLSYN